MSTESNRQTVEIERLQCAQTLPNGHRCGSPALKNEYFCYFHHSTRKPDPVARLASSSPAPSQPLELPMPQDRASLLISIGHVLQAIASKTIDRKDASLLLYGLQVANSALPRESRSANDSATPSRSSTRETIASTVPEEVAPVGDTASSKESATPSPASEILQPAEKVELISDIPHSLHTVEQHEEDPAEPTCQLTRKNEIAAAVRDAWYEATKEAAIDLQEAVARARAEAAAETEARLRAEFNLPQPASNEESGALLNLQAVAAPETNPIPSTRRHGCSRNSVCHSRRESAFAAAPSTATPPGGIDTPSKPRKIEGHGPPNPRPVRHRTLRRLHRPLEQIRDGSGPPRRRNRARP